ncbi:hypothetical protein ABC795_05290 [Blastococcus sp. HT6-30]
MGGLGAVIDGSLLLALAGLISTAPPCVLPLVPGYLLLACCWSPERGTS